MCTQLGEQLLASLGELTEKEAEQFWFAEAERRAGELTSGLVERIRAEVVNEEADSLLKGGISFTLLLAPNICRIAGFPQSSNPAYEFEYFNLAGMEYCKLRFCISMMMYKAS